MPRSVSMLSSGMATRGPYHRPGTGGTGLRGAAGATGAASRTVPYGRLPGPGGGVLGDALTPCRTNRSDTGTGLSPALSQRLWAAPGTPRRPLCRDGFNNLLQTAGRHVP
ncbi:hypothetical protein GCM10009753_10550 [Streptantibioticus ferralitis]